MTKYIVARFDHLEGINELIEVEAENKIEALNVAGKNGDDYPLEKEFTTVEEAKTYWVNCDVSMDIVPLEREDTSVIIEELLKKEIDKHQPGEKITFDKFNLSQKELYQQLSNGKLLKLMQVSFVGDHLHLEEIRYIKL